MSTMSVNEDLVVRGLPRTSGEADADRADDAGAARRRRSLLKMHSLAGWRRQAAETLVFLAVIAVLQRQLFGSAEVLGLPHPYWLPVLLASCQYGVRGGLIATVAASLVYLFELSPPSAAQDFYAYAGMVAIQPAAWLATALVIGGLRDLHIHQYTELADQLAASRRSANDLTDGLDRAAAEINALERRIAFDMSSVAALSRSLSQIDMKDRRAAATSLGELFRVGAGVGTFTFYLRESESYTPVWALEENSPRSTKSMAPIPSTAMESMMVESARRGITDDSGGSESGARRYVAAVPPSDAGFRPLAAIVCEVQELQDAAQFHRRAEEFGRMFATILQACPNTASE
jgi:K+-sensing histidine kinase KdpD